LSFQQLLTETFPHYLFTFFFQAQWSMVMEDLFRDNKPLSMYKQPSNLYDFKKKVISAMRSRYQKITGRGTHSGNVMTGDEDVSVVDRLAVKMYSEILAVQDKHEAVRREAELWKAQKRLHPTFWCPLPLLMLPVWKHKSDCSSHS
jgi:hypothetical protein